MTYKGLAALPPFVIEGVPSSAEILDRIISSVFVADRRGRLTYANAALRERSGLVDSEIDEETDDGQPLPRSLAAFRDAYRRAKAAGAPQRFDHVRVTRRDGEERLYAGWMVPLVEAGKHTGMLCTAEDVTELRATEEELRRSRAVLRAVEQSAMAIAVRDRDGRVIEQNAAFAEIGTSCEDDVQKQLRPQFEQLMTGEIDEIDGEVRCPAGRWYRVRASRVVSDRGEPPFSV